MTDNALAALRRTRGDDLADLAEEHLKHDLRQSDRDDLAAARGAAMQITAMRPRYLAREDVPADAVENERRVLEAKAREEGKPEAALPKIVEGMLNGFFKDNVLLEQSSVQDSKKTVKAQLSEAGVTVFGFAHFEIGAS